MLCPQKLGQVKAACHRPIQAPFRRWTRILSHYEERQMIIYRFITGDDDAKFCHRVTKALSEGWLLQGDPQYTGNSTLGLRCGQAVIKKVEDQPYDKDKKLTDY